MSTNFRELLTAMLEIRDLADFDPEAVRGGMELGDLLVEIQDIAKQCLKNAGWDADEWMSWMRRNETEWDIPEREDSE